jgi:hypothetical protein
MFRLYAPFGTVVGQQTFETMIRTFETMIRTPHIDARTMVATILAQQEADRLRSRIAALTPGNPAIFGFGAYAQCDEDGIIAHLLEQIEKTNPLTRTCIEFGVGDGIENNTHYLLLQGFRGVWIDGNRQNVEHISQFLGGLVFDRLVVRERFIALDNVADILQDAVAFLGSSDVDLFSIDLDGNDRHILTEALKHISPLVIVAEYNAKFRLPVQVGVAYDPAHTWAYDDYFGASLAALVEALPAYKLVSCSIAGANAFFVRRELSGAFPVYSAAQLYQPLRTHMALLKSGEHPPTLKFLNDSLKRTK